jgi:hypothetical protein
VSNAAQFHHQQQGDESSPLIRNAVADSADSTSPTSVIMSTCSSSFSPAYSKKKQGDNCTGGSAALLAIDLQNDFLAEGPDFYFGRWGSPISPRRQYLLKHIDDLAQQVRSSGGIAVYVKSAGVITKSSTPCCAVGTLGGELHKDAVALIQRESDDVGKTINSNNRDLILTKS